MCPKTIEEYIKSLENMINFFRSLLNETETAPTTDREYISELTDLRMLSKTKTWPEAVPEELICNEDEPSKIQRSIGILDELVPINLTDKTFLDFGCGEGHVAISAKNTFGAKKSVGYDTTKNWNQSEIAILTTNWEEVEKNGPYDIVLINDVLDHTLENILLKVKRVKKGKVYIRCHPWTSRTGNHLYKKSNKAYLHLVFDEKELSRMGLDGIPTVKHPIEKYKQLITDAGMNIIVEKIRTQPLEDFFINHKTISRRIKEALNVTDFPKELLEIQFIDFIVI